MRFNKKELELIKLTFKDNLPLLFALRKTFLQMELSEAEDIQIKNHIKDDVVQLIKKIFLPTLDGNAPINQVVDLWMTLQIADKNPDEAVLFMDARGKVIKYLANVIDIIGGKDNCYTIDFNSLLDEEANSEERFINIIARNAIIFHVEEQLRQINILANQTEETPEEEAKRTKTDSTK